MAMGMSPEVLMATSDVGDSVSFQHHTNRLIVTRLCLTFLVSHLFNHLRLVMATTDAAHYQELLMGESCTCVHDLACGDY